MATVRPIVKIIVIGVIAAGAGFGINLYLKHVEVEQRQQAESQRVVEEQRYQAEAQRPQVLPPHLAEHPVPVERPGVVTAAAPTPPANYQGGDQRVVPQDPPAPVRDASQDRGLNHLLNR